MMALKQELNAIMDPRKRCGYSWKPKSIFIFPNQPDAVNGVEYFCGLNVNGPESLKFAAALVEGESLPFTSSYSRVDVKWLKGSGADAVSELINGDKDYSAGSGTQLVLLFGTKGLEKLLDGMIEELDTGDPLIKVLCRGNDNSIPILDTYARGIFGSIPMIGGMSKVLEAGNELYPSLSGLAIPKVDFMEIRKFSISLVQFHKLSASVTLVEFLKLFGIPVRTVDNLRGIFIVHREMEKLKPDYSMSPFIQLLMLLVKRNPNFAVAGGFSDSFGVTGSRDNDAAVFGFLVIGEPNHCLVSTTQLDYPFELFSNQLKVSKVTRQEEMRKDQPFHSFCLIIGPNMADVTNVITSEGSRWDLEYYRDLSFAPVLGFHCKGQFCNERNQDSPAGKDSSLQFGVPSVYFFVTYRYAK